MSMIIIKDKSKSSIIISILSLVISLIAVLITYKIAHPKADLKIHSVSFAYDVNSFLQNGFIENYYIFIDVYNNGNKSAWISSIMITCSDTNKIRYSVILDRVYFPDVINPGTGETMLFTANILMPNLHVKKFDDLLYKFKYLQSDSELLSALKIVSPIKYKIQREFINTLILTSTISYNNNDSTISSDSIRFFDGFYLSRFLNEKKILKNLY